MIHYFRQHYINSTSENLDPSFKMGYDQAHHIATSDPHKTPSKPFSDFRETPSKSKTTQFRAPTFKCQRLEKPPTNSSPRKKKTNLRDKCLYTQLAFQRRCLENPQPNPPPPPPQKKKSTLFRCLQARYYWGKEQLGIGSIVPLESVTSTFCVVVFAEKLAARGREEGNHDLTPPELRKKCPTNLHERSSNSISINNRAYRIHTPCLSPVPRLNGHRSLLAPEAAAVVGADTKAVAGGPPAAAHDTSRPSRDPTASSSPSPAKKGE